MKIRTWLLFTYFIVMILPLIALYYLFSSVTSYYEEAQVEEYLQVYEKIHAIIPRLDQVELYERKQEYKDLLADFDEKVSVTLFSDRGLVLYESDYTGAAQEPRNILYQDLYEIKQELRSFTYKEPVFDGYELVGLFKIKVERDQLIRTIVTHSWLVTGLFIFIFLLIYGLVVYIVHARINRRLKQLMSEMSAFARGEPIEETALGKDEIGELKRHFYNMRRQIMATQEELATEQDEKEYMIATISHDLKTPLTSIKAYAESLDTNESLTAEEQRAYRKVIIEKSDFIKQMLDDLTVHSLLQSQEYELERVTVEGEEFFEMLVSGYEPLREEKELIIEAASEVRGLYEVDPQQLIRVVDNLMINAIQHTEVGGKILVQAFSDEVDLPTALFSFVRESVRFDFTRFAYLIVQNEGRGIKAENLNHIFEPLYQEDQARSKQDTSGTGLGLSITKQIVEKHGGTITVLSELNEGTCFICAIPKKGA